MLKNNIILKIISLVLAGIFSFQQVAWTAEDSTVRPANINPYSENLTSEETIRPENIYIPEDLAQIETKNFDKNKELIFNLQDCHSSLSAQYSIVNILKKLLSDYEMNLVAIEGASGYIDTSILKSVPDKNVKQQAAAALMKQGKLSAGEFFSVITDKDVALYGVEDEELYSKNLESFRDLYKSNKVLLRDVRKIIDVIEDAEDRVYSKELSMFIFKSRLHAASKISFEVYGKYLLRLCEEKNIHTEDIRNITSFLEVINIEKGVDFDEATLESKRLLSDLMAVASKEELEMMVLKTLDFNKNKIGPVEYHDWLFSFAAKKGKEADEYSELAKYVDYIKYYQTLDIVGLQDEISLLEKRILEHMFSGEKDRELYEQAELWQFVKALFLIQLTPEDLSFVKENVSSLNKEKIESMVGHSLKEAGIRDADKMIENIRAKAGEALDFYIMAEKRNLAMLSNTIKSMRKEGKHMAALISGGHHSRGLSSLMREKGVSYFILLPKYAVDSERPYVAVLTKKKGPYRELVKSGAYDLALEAYFDSGNIEEFHEMIALVVGGWALEKKVDLEKAVEEWADSYEEYYDQLSEVRKNARHYSQLEPDEFRTFLRSLSAILITEKQDECEVRIKGKTFIVDKSGIRKVTAGSIENIDSPAIDSEKRFKLLSGLISLYQDITDKNNVERYVAFSNIPLAVKPLVLLALNVAKRKLISKDEQISAIRQPLFKNGKLNRKEKPVFIAHDIKNLKDVDAAIASKADMLGIAVQVTKTGELVAWWGKVPHPEKGEIQTYEISLEEFTELVGEKNVILLKDIFDRAKGKIGIDMDLKFWSEGKKNDEGILYGEMLLNKLNELIVSKDMSDDVYIVSYKMDYLKRLKEKNPELAVGVSVGTEVNENKVAQRVDDLLEESHEMGMQPSGISFYADRIPRDVVKKVKSLDLVMIIKPDKKMSSFVYKNADLILANLPELEKEYPRLQEGEGHPEITAAEKIESGEIDREIADSSKVGAQELISLIKEEEKGFNPASLAENFILDMPPRITNRPAFAKGLFRRIYTLADTVIKDQEKVAVDFFEREEEVRTPDENQKLLLVYFNSEANREEVRRIKQQIEKDPELRLGKTDGISVTEVPGALKGQKLLVDIITIAKKNKYLKEKEKNAILKEINMPVYSGFTSPEGKMEVGYAAFRDTGDEMTVKDILYNIIPVRDQYNRVTAEIILEEYLEGFEETVANIQEQLPHIPEEFKDILDATKKEFLELPTEGRRIYKIRPEMLLSAKIEEVIDSLKEDKGLAERALIDDLKQLNDYVIEKIPYFDKIGEEILLEEKKSFDSAVEEVIDEEVNAISSDPTMANMIDGILRDIKRKVDKELDFFIKEGSGYRVVIILERMEKQYRQLIKHTRDEMARLSAEERERKGKFLDGYQLQLDLLKKTATFMVRKGKERKDFMLDQFADTNVDGKYVLFVEGDLLPSDIKKIHENVEAFVTTTAGTSAHWVLVANNFDITVFHLTGKGKVPVNMSTLQKEISAGHLVAINGVKGGMIVDPNDEVLREFKKDARALEAYEIFCQQKADKPAFVGEAYGEKERSLSIKANADEKAELIAALSKGADGIGLVRTEEFWLSEGETPGLREFIEDTNNEQAGEKVKEYFKGKALGLFRHAINKKNGEIEIGEISLRTIDVADDKQVPFDSSDLTGMRYYREKVTGNALLELQLEAIYEAVVDFMTFLLNEQKNLEKGKSAEVLGEKAEGLYNGLFQKLKGKIKIKFPQVESKQDMDFAVSKIDEVINGVSIENSATLPGMYDILRDIVKVGAMIESRESVSNLEEILPLADFISIGSNDLIRDIYREETERFLGKNLRRDIRARRFTKEVRGRVLDQMEVIARKVSRYNSLHNRNIKITICGDTATIDGYTLQNIYLQDKYNVNISQSVPRVKIGETKTFIRYVDVNETDYFFEREEDSDIYRAESLIWELIDEIDIMEVLIGAMSTKVRKRIILKLKSIVDLSLKLQAIMEKLEEENVAGMLVMIMEDCNELMAKMTDESSLPDNKELSKAYNIIKGRVAWVDSSIGQRGQILQVAKEIRETINAEPEVKHIAKILLEKGFFPSKKDEVDIQDEDKREDIEAAFEEWQRKQGESREEEKDQIEEPEDIIENVHLRIINGKNLHARPSIQLFKASHDLGVTLTLEEGFSNLTKQPISQVYESMWGEDSWTGEVDDGMFFLYLQATDKSLLKMKIEGKPEKVKAMKLLLDHMDEKRSINIVTDPEGKITLELEDKTQETAEGSLTQVSRGIFLSERSELVPGEKIFQIITESEFEKDMDEFLPERINKKEPTVGREEDISSSEENISSEYTEVEIDADLGSSSLKPKFFLTCMHLADAAEKNDIMLIFEDIRDNKGAPIEIEGFKVPFDIIALKGNRSYDILNSIFGFGTRIKFNIKGRKKDVEAFKQDLREMGIFRFSGSKDVENRTIIIDIFDEDEISYFEAEKILTFLKKYSAEMKILEYESISGVRDLEPFSINADTEISDIVDRRIKGAATLKIEMSAPGKDIGSLIEELANIEVLNLREVTKKGPERDFKGQHAGDTDNLLKKLIKDGQVIEIFQENNRLSGHTVKWVDNYDPGNDRDRAKGEKININDIFTFEQQSNILEWIQNKGSFPDGRGMVRFRVVKDNIYIGWENDIEHSNISHAGYRDGCIYIGQHLLASIFDYPDHPFRKPILDDDEYKHLTDENFDCRADHEGYLKRLNNVAAYCKSIEDHIKRKRIKPVDLTVEKDEEIEASYYVNLYNYFRSFFVNLMSRIKLFIATIKEKIENEKVWNEIKNEKIPIQIIDKIEQDIDFLMDGQWADGTPIMNGLKQTDRKRKEHVHYVIDMYRSFTERDFNKIYARRTTIEKDSSSETKETELKKERKEYFSLLRVLAKEFEKLSEKDKNVLFLAVILHDIGYTNSKISRFHTSKGTRPAERILRHYGINNKLIINKVQSIIQHHDKLADIGVDWLIEDVPVDDVLRRQLLIITAVDYMGKIKEHSDQNGKYVIDNILTLEYFKEMLRMYNKADSMTSEEFLDLRLESAGIKRPFQLSRPGLELSETELKHLKEIVENDNDEIFREMWAEKVRPHIFPLFMLLKERSGEDYVENLYKLMKLLAHISNIYIQQKHEEKINAVDFDASNGSGNEHYRFVLKSLESLFSKDIKEINEQSVRVEIENSNWSDVFGLKIAVHDPRKMSDDKGDISSEITDIYIETPEDNDLFELNIVFSEQLYDKINSYKGIKDFTSELDIPWGVNIIKSDLSDAEEISSRVEKIAGKKKGMVVIIDESTFDLNKDINDLTEEVSEVILEFSRSIKNDIIELITPETEGLDRVSIKNLDKIRIKEIMDVLVRMHDNYRSYKLSEKSVYQMRMENAFDQYKSGEKSVKLMSSVINQKNSKYLVHFAEASDFFNRKDLLIVPPGLEIQRRRSEQNLEGKADPYKDKFYIVGPNENMTENDKKAFKNRLMDLWMLNDIVAEDDIVILDKKQETYRTADIFDMINTQNQDAVNTNTGFRVICGDLEYDAQSAQRNILQLELQKGARHNRDQYEVFVNLLSSLNSEDSRSFLYGMIEQQKNNLYTYIPSALPVDLDREIKSYYDRYKEQVLIKA